MKTCGNSCIGMDQGSFPVFASGHAQYCIGAACSTLHTAQQRLPNASSEDFNARRSGWFFFEIRIMADVVSLLMLRSNFKSCPFTTLYATGESLSRLQVAEVWHAVLVVVHPIQSVSGNRRPRRESVPEHIRSFENIKSGDPVDIQALLIPGRKEPQIKVFSF